MSIHPHIHSKFVSKIAFGVLAVLTCSLTLTATMENTFAQDADASSESMTLDHFRGYQAEAIPAGWKMAGDKIEFNGEGDGDIITKETYDNFEMKVEWKISKGGNSGIIYRAGLGDGAPYITGPEFQILDEGKGSESGITSTGSLYALYTPTEDVRTPFDKWNETTIIVNENHVEHWLNGKKIVEATMHNEDWDKRIAASKFSTWEKFATLSEGHIALQNHGSAVSFRNISIKRLGEAHESEHSHEASEAVALFDGSSMDNFRGFHKEEIGKGWKITNGELEFDGSGGGDIITKKEYANFDLTFDWKVTDGANSGVMYRVATGENAPYFTGPEYQVLDDSKHADGKNPLTSAGSLYALYTPDGKELNAVGEWNQSRIVLDGNHVEHWLNGKKVVETELHSDDWNERVAKSKFNSWKKFGTKDKGHICFQDHGDQVFFRNIMIKELPAK